MTDLATEQRLIVSVPAWAVTADNSLLRTGIAGFGRLVDHMPTRLLITDLAALHHSRRTPLVLGTSNHDIRLSGLQESCQDRSRG